MYFIRNEHTLKLNFSIHLISFITWWLRQVVTSCLVNTLDSFSVNANEALGTEMGKHIGMIRKLTLTQQPDKKHFRILHTDYYV